MGTAFIFWCALSAVVIITVLVFLFAQVARENDRLSLALEVLARPDSQEQVGEFHRAFNQPVRITPTADIPADEAQLRIALIEEELEELRVAVAAGDIVEIADALGDLKYVVEGGGWYWGVDLNAVVDEIHGSNMSKLGKDGRPLVSDGTDGFPKGKVLKGPNYFRPNIAAVLERTSGHVRLGRTQLAIRMVERPTSRAVKP